MNSNDLHIAKQAVVKGMLDPNQLAKCIQYQKNQYSKGKHYTLSSIILQSGCINESQWKTLEKELSREDDFSVSFGMKEETDITVKLGEKTKEKKEDTTQNDFSISDNQNISTKNEENKRVSPKMINDFSLDGSDALQENKKTEQKIGRYDILGELGRGGMGCVYKAYDPVLERIVALKVLLHEENNIQVERFLREAKATAKLHHPHIVTLYDIGQTNEKHYFTMDFIEGNTLDTFIKKHSPSTKQIAKIIKSVGDGVQLAHINGIIHRDLKPANIMIDAKNQPIVMDFGLAKVFEESKKLSRSGTIMGTLNYMAPEQAKGKVRDIDQRSDVYSLGAILYYCLAGRPPITSNTFPSLIEKIIKEDPIPLRKVKRKIPSDLEKICMKALEKEKKNRYQSVASLVDDLIRFIKGEPVEAKSMSIFELCKRKALRNKPIAISILLLPLFVFLFTFVSWKIQEQKIQKRLINLEEKSKRILKKLMPASEIEKKYNIKSYNHHIPEDARRQIELCLRKLLDARILCEKYLALAPQNQKAKKKLYFIEKEIGKLSLLSKNYIFSILSFTRCKSLIDSSEAAKLLENVKIQRKTLKKKQLMKLDEMMTSVKRTIPSGDIFDEYVTTIIRMRGIYILEGLVKYLESKFLWQRLLAINTLGKFGDTHTKIAGMDIGFHLLKRLRHTEISHNREIVELIWALGRLRESRASEFVFQVRQRLSSDDNFLNKTDLPYSWIPIKKITTSKGQNKEYKHAVMLMRKNDYKRALPLLQHLVAKYPKAPNLLYYKAQCYMGLEKYEKALKYYTKAIQLHPEMARAYSDRGIIYRKLGKISFAIEDYTKAIELNPKDDHGYNLRGVAFIKKGELDRGYQDLSKSIKLNANNAEAYNNRGIYWVLKENLERAIADYTTAIQLNPRHISAYSNRASIYSKQKRWLKAIEDITKVLSFKPDYANMYKNRATCYYRAGIIGSAVEDWKTYVKLMPNAADVKKIKSYIRKCSRK